MSEWGSSLGPYRGAAWDYGLRAGQVPTLLRAGHQQLWLLLPSVTPVVSELGGQPRQLH